MEKRSAVVLVAILGGCGSGGGGGSETCRSTTEACAVTADCCDSLICTNNVCTPPATCRAANAACAVTADCCNPLVCLANRCQIAPPADVCGDDICSGNETSTSCCSDCGCPGGTTCNGTTCINVGFSNMTWNMAHQCPNGETIELRFFDVTNFGVWPSDLTEVYVLPSAQTQGVTLACTTGAQICFGGRQPQHGLFWGIDTDASKPCTACCLTCATGTTNQALTCN